MAQIDQHDMYVEFAGQGADKRSLVGFSCPQLVQHRMFAVEQNFHVEQDQRQTQLGSQLSAAIKEMLRAATHIVFVLFIRGRETAQQLTDGAIGQKVRVSRRGWTHHLGNLDAARPAHNHALAAVQTQRSRRAKSAKLAAPSKARQIFLCLHR
ncbi:MAG TPA: hypothetical protein VMF89_17480 [Polyangiales bacterium]|nr:hypothetical protein [Polyangiales bacterium]